MRSKEKVLLSNVVLTPLIVRLSPNLYAHPVFWDYSRLVALYKIGDVPFHLIGTNGFRVNAEN